MTKNLWEKEERQVFRSLTRQYKQEGYDIKEAKKLAKQIDKSIRFSGINGAWVREV